MPPYIPNPTAWTPVSSGTPTAWTPVSSGTPTAWTDADSSSPTSWSPTESPTQVVTIYDLADNLGNTITDNLGNNIVQIVTQLTPQNATEWTQAG